MFLDLLETLETFVDLLETFLGLLETFLDLLETFLDRSLGQDLRLLLLLPIIIQAKVSSSVDDVRCRLLFTRGRMSAKCSNFCSCCCLNCCKLNYFEASVFGVS